MSKLTQAEEYLLERPHRVKRCPSKLSKQLGITEEEVKRATSNVRAILRAKEIPQRLNQTERKENAPNTKKVDNEKGTIESDVITTFEPKNDIELAELHKIDLTKYKISTYWSKLKPNGDFNSSVLATLRKVEDDLTLQKEILLEELSKEFPEREHIERINNEDQIYAYEVNIPDVHFGKLAHSSEVGEDYDLKIAEERYTRAIEDLLELVDHKKVKHIIFPIGNDMINIDSRRNQTYGGTPQDSDSRFFKIVRTVKEILIRSINRLKEIAQVRVVVVSGNHDPEAMFMIGEMLDAYYTNDPNVDVDNSPSQRKYLQFGNNGFLYTHGNEEKHQDLGLIFATEEPEMWAETKFRFAKLGHFHKNKKISYVSVDEYQGFQVQILPSLSGSDAWHASKGYRSLKQAKGFLYHSEKGQIAEYTFNA